MSVDLDMLKQSLLPSLDNLKKTGVNRHFHMVGIHDKLVSTYKKITAKQIWDYLSELFDLNALNESEILPFPNKEADFTLPDTDYSELQEHVFPRLIVPKVEKTEIKVEKQEKPEKIHETGSTKSSKSEGRHSTGAAVLNTPDTSPKRKRTRHTPSSTVSPATPDAPPPKRRR